MKYLIITLLIPISLTFAQSSINPETAAALDAINTANQIVDPLAAPAVACSMDAIPSQPLKCSDITNNFCAKLWDNDNEGNLKVFDGQILAGKSVLSKMKLSVLVNDRALVNSIDNLPIDIKMALGPSLKKLENHLKNENESTKWMRDYTQIKQEITNVIQDVTDDRFNKRGLPVKASESEKWNIDQNVKYYEGQRSVYDDITIAKYENHPNWLRVKKLFPKVKANIIKQIGTYNIPDAQKIEMQKKVESIALTLPLQDPTKAGIGGNCAENEVNANYAPKVNNFFVCAGLFNQYQSESALAFVIGHELSHSIDSESLAVDRYKKTETSKALQKLVNNGKQAYKCSEWRKIDKNIFKPDDYQIKDDPMEKLYSCMRSTKKLTEMTAASVSGTNSASVAGFLSYYAAKNSFSDLLQKEKKLDKKIVANEAYYRPDLAYTAERRYYGDANEFRDPSYPEVFMQHFYCNLEEANLTKEAFEKLDSESRVALFEKSIDQTSTTIENSQNDYSQYCGKNCADLASYNLSYNPTEQVADWHSTKAFPDFLAEIKAEDKVQATALATSMFCPEGKLESSDLSLAEKKFSFETHPDNKNRRLALYSPEISAAIGCQIDVKEQGDSKCNP